MQANSEATRDGRRRFLRSAALAVTTAAVGTAMLSAEAGDPLSAQAAPSLLRSNKVMPALDGAVEWLNSPPLNASDLRGRVVLVSFWTFSCINSHRVLPYLRAWAAKYKDNGLVVINVHTPEFSFEKNLENVRKATVELNVGTPVAVDTEGAIWRAFRNSAWPAFYFVDARGIVRHEQFGEGHYEDDERLLQKLLTEAGARGIKTDLVQIDASGSQAPPDWENQRSPETYVGYERTQNFASPGGIEPDRTHTYAAADRLAPNAWALSGDWLVAPEAATLERANGRIAYRFHARDLHLVMGASASGMPVSFRVLIDGKPPGAAHGIDVDAQGRGLLTEHRLYQLVRQSQQPIEDRLFEIEFLEPGAQAYSFTFG